MLSTDKYFEMVPRHYRAVFISESFALNLLISTPLRNM